MGGGVMSEIQIKCCKRAPVFKPTVSNKWNNLVLNAQQTLFPNFKPPPPPLLRSSLASIIEARVVSALAMFEAVIDQSLHNVSVPRAADELVTYGASADAFKLVWVSCCT